MRHLQWRSDGRRRLPGQICADGRASEQAFGKSRRGPHVNSKSADLKEMGKFDKSTTAWLHFECLWP